MRGESYARIHAVLEALIVERQELRRTGADRPVLEANRVAIVYWQQRLAEQAELSVGARL
jgi:hypothetical protein